MCTQRGLGALGHSGRLLINWLCFWFFVWVGKAVCLFNSFDLSCCLPFSTKPTILVSYKCRSWLWVEILPSFLRTCLKSITCFSKHLNALMSLFLCHPDLLSLLYPHHWIKLLLQHLIFLFQLLDRVIESLHSSSLTSILHQNASGIKVIVKFWVFYLLPTVWLFTMTSQDRNGFVFIQFISVILWMQFVNRSKIKQSTIVLLFWLNTCVS